MHYRKIYEQHHGSIPDNYDVHHIDGNRSNNSIDNLKAVSIQEHYDIHFEQGDWRACQAILMRFNGDKSHFNVLASKVQNKLIEENKHNFQLMSKERRTEISLKACEKMKTHNTGLFRIINDPVLCRENARKGGKESYKKKAGFHSKNYQSESCGNTFWWIDVITGERKRSKTQPSPNWKRDMK